MAKQITAGEGKAPLIQRLKIFTEEVKAEMNKVTWPSMEDLRVSTKVTLFLLGVMAVIIFGFDQIFQFVVLTLLRLTT
jgi:preprotein translocase subunit SecE